MLFHDFTIYFFYFTKILLVFSSLKYIFLNYFRFLDFINNAYFDGKMDLDKKMLNNTKPQRTIVDSNNDTGIEVRVRF